MPQGGIEEGETKEQALWREMQEETGTTTAKIRLELPKPLTYHYPLNVMSKRQLFKGQKLHWFILDYRGTDDQFQPGQEFQNWEWFDINRVLKEIVEWKRPMYALVFNFI